MGGTVTFARDGQVVTVTLSHPGKLNAISTEMAAGLAEALTAMKDDPAVRVLLLTGAGEKAFISGGDISQFDKTRPNADFAATFRERQALPSAACSSTQ